MKKQPFKSISQRLYAVSLNGLTTEEPFKAHNGKQMCWYRLPAVWYKKKNGFVFAAYGELSCILDADLKGNTLIERMESPLTVMVGRYDGKSFWGEENLEKQKKIIELLKPMLFEAPNFPAGYDGWYNVKKHDTIDKLERLLADERFFAEAAEELEAIAQGEFLTFEEVFNKSK